MSVSPKELIAETSSSEHYELLTTAVLSSREKYYICFISLCNNNSNILATGLDNCISYYVICIRVFFLTIQL